jgi:cell wall-associated NlpC family hydrolase
VPGDIVVFDTGSHVGIYLGGNMMIHAPYPGRTVSIQAIYTTNHYFVRAGI